jgi:hypothetical protein
MAYELLKARRTCSHPHAKVFEIATRAELRIAERENLLFVVELHCLACSFGQTSRFL